MKYQRGVGFVMDTGLRVYPKSRKYERFGCVMPPGRTIVGVVVNGVVVPCHRVRTNGGDVLAHL